MATTTTKKETAAKAATTKQTETKKVEPVVAEAHGRNDGADASSYAGTGQHCTN